MPVLTINTNLASSAFSESFFDEVAVLLAELLKKPKEFIFVHLCASQKMSFRCSQEPCISVSLGSIGSISEIENRNTAEKLMNFLEKETKVPLDRMFLHFENIKRDMMAWNGALFKKP